MCCIQVVEIQVSFEMMYKRKFYDKNNKVLNIGIIAVS